VRRYAIYAVACFTAILLSRELAYSLPIAGVGPDLLIIVLAAFAAGEQPRVAAVGGYTAGFVRDLLLTTPVGLGALAYAVTGYAVALVGPLRGVWAFVAVVAGATFVSQTIHGVATIVIGQNVDASMLPRVVLVTTMYDAILAPLLMPLLRRLVITEAAGATTE
jgi:rod shape-determining protein MreD